mmetsp:Transcript_4235/g.14729  ORF Transcript_4235/g.14729 Transcript_4235/m.14729 type:complete len:445 (-) Transcript_4235:103-1437(-)|eukprot:CAMPEP_0170133858 /NCGR_PEP_ID=MMETSP0033_2-20121228/1577_1 /TAXON_ID=195969 /ORGANISM="Dolichomastix tenuilepis, Strain CCMP3274" /LENGTH=444 /DNA_ID=CAMNT_0010369389 /DNA_START=96 /DNA_END=1430 /DNA_ORIENTATION=-
MIPPALSALFFLNLRGELLIHKLFRDDVGRNMADLFRTKIIGNKASSPSPVQNLGSTSFMYMRSADVYVVAVTKENSNALLAFKFMNDLVKLFKSYFNTFDEDSLRNNFVLIYELLDEIMDFGFPQIMTSDLLKTYITQEGVRSARGKEEKEAKGRETTMQVTGAVAWRREGIKYKKNEVYLDIVENVNLLMSSNGTVLRSDVSGQISMKCILSGMPELKLGLNDKLGMESDGRAAPAAPRGKAIELDDVTFHQCVNLSRFSTDKTVSFVPPDGEFELMRYRVTDGLTLPFRVLPIIKECGRTRIQVNVKLKSMYSDKLSALVVIARVPVPKHTARATIQVSGGKAKYNAAQNCLVWKVKMFRGQMELALSADVELVSTLKDKEQWNRPPINLEFSLPMFTASGLRVRFLKVWETKLGYATKKFVRYVTRAGGEADSASYEIRT